MASSSIQVKIEHMATGQAKTFRLPDDMRVSDIIDKVTKAFGGDGGQSRLINKTKGFDYLPNDTLKSRNTLDTDTLSLVQEFKAGS